MGRKVPSKQVKQLARSHFISKSSQKPSQYEVVWTRKGKRHRAVRSTSDDARELARARIALGDVDVRFRRVGAKRWQPAPKGKPKAKASKRDALDYRLPGSFESGKRR